MNVSSYLFILLNKISQFHLSSYYACEMYECVQLSLDIMRVKCTNVSSYLFILRL